MILLIIITIIIIIIIIIIGAEDDWDIRIYDLVKNPVVNFGEVRRAQLAKPTLLTFTLVPLGYFQIL